jgi:hypothetical protein
MPVQFENYTHSFELNGKPVFAPNDLGRKIGNDVKRRVEQAFEFEPFYFHLGPGGHVSAIHAHRENEFFCKVDIENFFYSISGNRVVRTLREVGIERPKHYGKWSCVKNPYEQPRYSLPYGFVQSPILATLVLSTSAVGNFLRQLPSTITKAVYVDDITLSSNDPDALRNCYDSLLGVMEEASLLPKATKCVAPTTELKVFNCSLETSQTSVLPERREEFFRVPRSPNSIDGFVRYCDRVELGNK